MSDARRYRYAPRANKIAFALFFFALCAVFLLVEAKGNDRGLRISGLVDLDPHQADVLYAVLGTISLAFVVLGASTLVRWRKREQFVVLDDDGLVVPGGPFKQDRRIAWPSIQSVGEMSIYRNRFLEIRHTGGKSLLSEAMLGEAAFAELRALLTERSAPLPTARVV